MKQKSQAIETEISTKTTELANLDSAIESAENKVNSVKRN